MRRPGPRQRSRPRASDSNDARGIDALYGLEPVFEPGDTDSGAGVRGGAEFQTVQCPYCGERFEALLDLSAGSARYIEDCQVCCQPIEFQLEVDPAGALVSLTLQRGSG